MGPLTEISRSFQNLRQLMTPYGLSWNESTDAYQRLGPSELYVQELMRRCIVNDNGEVVYYLDPSDSTLKADGSAAALDGTDGQVMVQIPKFYYSYSYASNVHSWKISLYPFAGGQVHPAFFKNGKWVDYRYVGAYEGIGYDNGTSAYVDGAGVAASNWAGGAIDTVNDKLGSVSGIIPMTDETRAEFRALAANRGTGWRLMDFYLASAIQLLMLIEYQTFNMQTAIGTGNTSYSAWDFGECIAASGMSNSDGNATNASDTAEDAIDTGGSYTNGDEVSEYMTYRGIENIYGSTWGFIDGFNINDNKPYISNDDSHFADDTDTDYITLEDIVLHNANGYQSTLEQIKHGFLPASVGGSSSTKITDYYYQAAGWRVALLGGGANNGAQVGAFCWVLHHGSSFDSAGIGGRLCF